MPRESRSYSHLPPPLGAYAHAVKAGGFLFVSGLTARGTGVEQGNIRAQTEAVLEELKGVLDAEGLSFDDVVKVTVYVTDISQLRAIHEVRYRYFTRELPASTLVEVSQLVDPNLLIEIEAVALLRQ